MDSGVVHQALPSPLPVARVSGGRGCSQPGSRSDERSPRNRCHPHLLRLRRPGCEQPRPPGKGSSIYVAASSPGGQERRSWGTTPESIKSVELLNFSRFLLIG